MYLAKLILLGFQFHVYFSSVFMFLQNLYAR